MENTELFNVRLREVGENHFKPNTKRATFWTAVASGYRRESTKDTRHTHDDVNWYMYALKSSGILPTSSAFRLKVLQLFKLAKYCNSTLPNAPPQVTIVWLYWHMQVSSTSHAQ